MRLVIRLLPLGMLACMPTLPTESDATVLRELQIVGIEVDPPQARPGTSSAVTVTAADPRERGADVLVWSCTDFGIGCFEQLLPDGSGRPLTEWATVGSLEGDLFSARFELPSVPEPMVIQAEEEDLVMLLWVLTCAPGVCEVIERVRANPAPGTEAWDAAARLLAWPDEWLDDLESGWSSLAVKAVPITTTIDNANPVIYSSGARIALAHGSGEGEGTFYLEVVDESGPGELSLDVFTTFGRIDGSLAGGSAVLAWDAPYAMVGLGRVYAVVSDGDGGQVVWHGDVSVLP